MKRDMDLIRSILVQLEKEEPLDQLDVPQDTLLHHLDLMLDAGLLAGEPLRGGNGELVAASIQKVTWDGYDFIEVSRNEDSWSRAKKRAMIAGGWTLALLKELLLAEAKTKLGL